MDIKDDTVLFVVFYIRYLQGASCFIRRILLYLRVLQIRLSLTKNQHFSIMVQLIWVYTGVKHIN